MPRLRCPDCGKSVHQLVSKAFPEGVLECGTCGRLTTLEEIAVSKRPSTLEERLAAAEAEVRKCHKFHAEEIGVPVIALDTVLAALKEAQQKIRMFSDLARPTISEVLAPERLEAAEARVAALEAEVETWHQENERLTADWTSVSGLHRYWQDRADKAESELPARDEQIRRLREALRKIEEASWDSGSIPAPEVVSRIYCMARAALAETGGGQ